MNGDGTPVLGHAQRGAACEAPPPTITRELQALMAGMRLEDGADMEQVGGHGEVVASINCRGQEPICEDRWHPLLLCALWLLLGLPQLPGSPPTKLVNATYLACLFVPLDTACSFHHHHHSF